MDRLHQMTVFVAVAEAESFNGGARKLGMSPPAITRVIAALEKRLKVKLLDRTTRYVRVTEAGKSYLENARRIISEADEADEATAGINAAPRGHLSVTTPVQFGKLYVMPVITEYLYRYPEVDVSTLMLDRIVNLLEEEIDVGVRIGELADSSMRAIQVGQVRRVACASPRYLQENGEPKTPADLIHHQIVSATSVTPSRDWKFGKDENILIRIKPRLAVTSVDAAADAAASGVCITRLMSYQLAPYLQSGRLKPILTEYEPTSLPIHVLHREGRYASAKIRAFIDLIVDRLRAHDNLNTVER